MPKRYLLEGTESSELSEDLEKLGELNEKMSRPKGGLDAVWQIHVERIAGPFCHN